MPERKPSKTILCVEDEELQLRLRKALFESAGYRVLLARSGVEALQAFESNAVDAVVLDYSLAGANGVAVATQIKQQSPSVPIVVLSGYGLRPEQAEGVVDRWFQKADIEPEDLLSEVRELLVARSEGESGQREQPPW